MARKSNKELMEEVKRLEGINENLRESLSKKEKEVHNHAKEREDDHRYFEASDKAKMKTINNQVCRINELEEMNKSLEERKNNEISCLELKLEGRDKKIENYEKILIAVAAKFEAVSVVANSAISDLIGKRG